MPLNDWEYSYNGLTFGAGLPIGVTKVEGLNPPDVRVNEVDRPAADGVWLFAKYLGPRRIVISRDIVANGSTLQAREDTWRSAFKPQSADLPLTFKLPNKVEQRVNCVPVRRFFDIDGDYELGIGRWIVQLIAQDPLIYAETADTVTITASTGTGTQTGNNAGHRASRPVAVLRGPGTTFTIYNDTQGKFIKLNATLADLETWTIDFSARTIVKDSDSSSKYSTLDSTSKWWDVQPGDNTLRLVVASGYGANTRIVHTYRDAWD